MGKPHKLARIADKQCKHQKNNKEQMKKFDNHLTIKSQYNHNHYFKIGCQSQSNYNHRFRL